MILKTNRPVRVYTNTRNNETGKWALEVLHEQGWLHSFGCDVEEDAEGFSSFSIAIVELPGGTVIMPRADRIKFLDAQGAETPKEEGKPE